MYYIGVAILFSATLGSGLLSFSFPSLPVEKFKNILAFSGSYLFSITLMHLLPELFEEAHRQGMKVGIYLVAGFFLQSFLDLIGGDIAHGHIDDGHAEKSNNNKHFSLTLFLALGLHAFLEGFLPPGQFGEIWLAILVHKIPVTFALAAMLKKHNAKRKIIICLLILFALATPLGCLVYSMLQGSNAKFQEYLLYPYALSVGGLFHIATVILFESNPDHHISKTKWGFLTLGIMLAVLSAYYMPH